MRTTRLPHPKPSPRLDHLHDEIPRGKCDDNLELVDLVWQGPRFGQRAALRLLPLCGGCSLRRDCWADPEWRAALRESA